MIIEFDKSFSKSLDKINDSIVKLKIEKIIIELEKSSSIKEIKGLKKLTGFQSYYRMRLGNYRIGLELRNNYT